MKHERVHDAAVPKHIYYSPIEGINKTIVCGGNREKTGILLTILHDALNIHADRFAIHCKGQGAVFKSC